MDDIEEWFRAESPVLKKRHEYMVKMNLINDVDEHGTVDKSKVGLIVLVNGANTEEEDKIRCKEMGDVLLKSSHDAGISAADLPMTVSAVPHLQQNAMSKKHEVTEV